jgi:hypothetical protein
VLATVTTALPFLPADSLTFADVVLVAFWAPGVTGVPGAGSTGPAEPRVTADEVTRLP